MQEQTFNESPQQQCIFCLIAAGSIPSRKVFEDDKVIVVMDINPASPGHLLLVPKEHVMIMPQAPDPLVEHMGMVAKALSHALLKALKAQGTNVFIANGSAAGQRAQHFIMHVIPRKENDGITAFKLPERALKEEQNKLLQKAFRGEKIEESQEKRSKKERRKKRKAQLGRNQLGSSGTMTCEVCGWVREKKNAIFEDDKMMALVAPKPAVPGHVLLVPKTHSTILEQVPDFVIGPMFVQANKLSTKAFELIGAEGTNILINNGTAAGQALNHFVMHVIPRKQGDGLRLQWQPKQLSDEEMSRLEQQILEETKRVGEFEKEPPKPVKEKKPEAIEDEEENYLLKQLERLP